MAPPARARRSAAPTLRVERELLRARADGGAPRWLAAVDEVGRGALAGPVSVGVVLVDLEVGTAPRGLRDSKLLTPEARRDLVPRLRRWAPAHAVGHAGPDEIDAVGILAALSLAARRALAALPEEPDLVLLDGNHDWLTRCWPPGPRPAPEATLFDSFDAAPPALIPVVLPECPAVRVPRVRTRIKADMACSSVAAASVFAKVERDDHMVSIAPLHPAYGWEINKGYATPEHQRALRELGPSELHRRSWRLGGPPGDEIDLTAADLLDDVLDDVEVSA